MIDYLIEIKNRVIILIFSSTFTLMAAYFYKRELLFLTVAQFTDDGLNYKNFNFFYIIFTDVKEIFSVYISMITYITGQVMIIFFFYHMFVFVVPTLRHKEYNIIKKIYCCAIITVFISIIISILIIVPLTWEFFLGFQGETFKKPLNWFFDAKLSDFIHFYTTTYYFFSMYFQTFIMSLLVYNLLFQNITRIKKLRKVFYFSFLIFSAVVSPPDFIIQVFITFFFLSFYEFFLLLNLFNFNFFRNNFK